MPASRPDSITNRRRREIGRRRSRLTIGVITLISCLLSVTQPAAAQNQADLQRWRTLETSSSRADLESYLKQFPQGRYRLQVIDRLMDLGPGQSAGANSTAEAGDTAAWSRLGDDAGRAELEDYLRRFPRGQNRSAAIDRLIAMGPQVAALAPVKPPEPRSTAKPRRKSAAPPKPKYSRWQHGQTLSDCTYCPQLTVLRAGSFRLGSPPDEPGRWSDEGPAVTISLRRPIAMSINEITRGQYARFSRETNRAPGACQPPAGLGDPNAKLDLNWREPGFKQTDVHPVICVNWEDAQAYVSWLSHETGKRYRLPTEAEWEYAARGGTAAPRFWRADYSSACGFANVADRAAAQVFKDWNAAPCDDGQVFTAPVGSYRANSFGLHDMLGNVWEWVGDCWNDAHEPADPHVARTGGDCGRRVIKGGSWISIERLVRIATRGADKPASRTIGTGFRVVRELEP